MLLAPAVLTSTGSPVGSWFPYLLALRALFSYRLQHRGQPRLSHFSADRHRGVSGDHSQDTPRIEVFLTTCYLLTFGLVSPAQTLGYFFYSAPRGVDLQDRSLPWEVQRGRSRASRSARHRRRGQRDGRPADRLNSVARWDRHIGSCRHLHCPT